MACEKVGGYWNGQTVTSKNSKAITGINPN